MSTNEESMQFGADIVIVGGGGAGLGAAVTAAEARCQHIIVLEKRGNTGGTSAMASGIFGADSPTQRRQAIQAPKDEMFRRFMKWHHLAADPRIIRAFVNLSGETVRWLEDKGIFFYCRSHSPQDDPLTWHVPDGQGAEIMKTLVNDCRRLGVRIECNTTAKMLLKDAAGKITGVIAERNGRDVTYNTKTVIISGGGFGGNLEWVKKVCPKYVPGMAMVGMPNQGEGIAMALEAGAAPDGLGMLMAAGPVATGGVIKLGTEPDVVPIATTFLVSEPSTIMVNKNGRRFTDETIVFNRYEAINALLRQPEAIAYTLFDARLVRYVTDYGLTSLASGYQYGPRQRSPLPEGLDRELAAKADGDSIKVADTWAGIADWIGVDVRVLEETIRQYNEGCYSGYDAVFGKDRRYLFPLQEPPYYALRNISTSLNTMGGIKVNERMEVLDAQHNPIPGLYAAGVDTGGWTSDTYCAALPGTAFGYALNSGRIAGWSAVDYTRNGS